MEPTGAGPPAPWQTVPPVPLSFSRVQADMQNSQGSSPQPQSLPGGIGSNHSGRDLSPDMLASYLENAYIDPRYQGMDKFARPSAASDATGMSARSSFNEAESAAQQSTLLKRSHLNQQHDEDIFAAAVGGLEVNQEPSSLEVEHVREVNLGHQPSNDASRTLFVRNLPADATEDEIRVTFQVYGDVRSVYTAAQQRGFVLVTYYDLRAAMAAVSGLQGKVVRGMALDLNYHHSRQAAQNSLLNQGTLVVFNLDPESTNQHLVWLFSKFGEVRDITQSPERANQKMVTFYDVRHALAALKAMNKAEHLNVLPAQLTLEQAVSQSMPPPTVTIPPGTVAQALQMRENQAGNSNLPRPASMQSNMWDPTNQDGSGMRGAGNQGPSASGLSTPVLGSSPSMGGGMSHMPQEMQQQVPGAYAKYPSDAFNAKGMHVSDSASSMSNVLGGLPGASGPFNGRGPLPGNMSLQGNAMGMGAGGGMADQNLLLQQYQNMQAAQLLQGTGGLDQSNAANLLLGVNPLGSLPNLSQDPSQLLLNAGLGGQMPGANLWDANNNLYSNALLNAGLQNANLAANLQLQELQARQQQVALANLAQLQAQGLAGSSTINLAAAQILQAAGLNPALAAAGGYGLQGVNQALTAQLLQQAALAGLPGALGGLGAAGLRGNHGRQDALRGGRLSRRTTDPMADAERRAQQEKLYALDPDKIRAGEDKRTTLMVKNIPNKYTQKMLLATIDEYFRGSYDFFYLPIDFKNKCNVGYAFINMLTPLHILPLVERFNNKKWERFNSEKICSISYARIQGRAALVAHFQNSSLMHEDKRCRPILFNSEGQEISESGEPFPSVPSHGSFSGHNLSNTGSGSFGGSDSGRGGFAGSDSARGHRSFDDGGRGERRGSGLANTSHSGSSSTDSLTGAGEGRR